MEFVLAVKRELVEHFIPSTGITTDHVTDVVDIIINRHEFVSRDKAEDDTSFKQIIPYVVLCRGDEVFATRRLKRGTETRLHGLISLGIGGHINPDTDGGGQDVLYRGLKRELEEEVNISSYASPQPRGMINDDSNEVGRVHLGMFFTIEVEGDVSVRETDKLEGLWIQRAELCERTAEMETWSQLVVEAFFKTFI